MSAAAEPLVTHATSAGSTSCPGLLFYVLFTLAPLLHTVYYSLFSWDGLTEKTWVGLANYSEALRDDVLLDSFVALGRS